MRRAPPGSQVWLCRVKKPLRSQALLRVGQRGGRAAGGRAAGRPGAGMARDAAQRRLGHTPPAAAHRAARGGGALSPSSARDPLAVLELGCF